MNAPFTPTPIKGNADLFMLFRHWNKRDMPAGGFMAEQKMDGWRAGYWRGLDGTAKLWTKNGHAIEGVGHILHRLAIMERIAGEPMFFDGEFVVTPTDGSSDTLAATKHWCESGHKLGGENGTLHLFDAMPERDWRAGGCDMPLEQRKARLVELHDAAEAEIALSWEWREGTRGKEPCTPTVIIPHDWLFGADDVMMMAEDVWRRGGEGLVLKDPASPYRRNRSPFWWKVKQEGIS